MKHQKHSSAPWTATAYGQQRILSQVPGADGHEPDRTDLKILRIEPGKSTSHHFHLLRRSWFYVLSGSLRVSSSFEGWFAVLAEGDSLELDPGEDHFFVNIGMTDALVLEVGSPGHLPHDKIAFSAPGNLCSVVPGRFWREGGGRRRRLKASGVETFETACHCHSMGVDAIGFDLDVVNWSQLLARMQWTKQLSHGMSLFLVTHLTQPLLVTAILHRLGCDTLQWRGTESPELLSTLYPFVRKHGFRVVHTLWGTHAEVLEKIDVIRPWVSLLDAVVWQPVNPGAQKDGLADGVVAALAMMQLPWMVAVDAWSDSMAGFEKDQGFMGLDVRGHAWKYPCGDSGVLVMDREKIQSWVQWAS
ncbi:MAG: cupin domain-containing protein [Magnetococcales bacterium]|nr:cupin domain-containing protein [Magnetococcales bacterium]MBF0149547.1 cupin domain-containing protein [Magnetococcales bacterium]